MTQKIKALVEAEAEKRYKGDIGQSFKITAFLAGASFRDELDGEDQQDDPYWYWPQCDVDGCEGVSGYNGMGWRETGYWCLCSKHADAFRKGEPQPQMRQSSIDKEATRDKKTGQLP